MPFHSIDTRLSHLAHIKEWLAFDVTHMGEPDSYLLSPCCGHYNNETNEGFGYRAVYSPRPRLNAFQASTYQFWDGQPHWFAASGPGDPSGVNPLGEWSDMDPNNPNVSNPAQLESAWNWTDWQGGDQSSFFTYQQRAGDHTTHGVSFISGGSWVLVSGTDLDKQDIIDGTPLDAAAKWWVTSQADTSTLSEELEGGGRGFDAYTGTGMQPGYDWNHPGHEPGAFGYGGLGPTQALNRPDLKSTGWLRKWEPNPQNSTYSIDSSGDLGLGESASLPTAGALGDIRKIWWVLYGERTFLGVTMCNDPTGALQERADHWKHGSGANWRGGIGRPDSALVNGIVPASASARGGYHPGIKIWGGDIDGVTAEATVNDAGTITAITVIDPGIAVVTHERPDEDIVVPEVGVTMPGYYTGFNATARVSSDPAQIKAALSGLFKTKAQIRAEVCDGYQDPLAQTFLVQDNKHPDGVFIRSVDVCFAKKPNYGEHNPIYLDIRPTVNGYPDAEKNMITVSLDPDDVNVAPGSIPETIPPWWDADEYIMTTPVVLSKKAVTFPNFVNQYAYTRFLLPYPLYLASATEYAIVLRSNDLNYRVYIADVNGEAIMSSAGVDAGYPDAPIISGTYAKQYGGVLFRSSNGRTWTPNHEQDLMFRINKCNFGGSSISPATGTFTLGGQKTSTSDFEYDRISLNMHSLFNPNPSTTDISATVKTQKKSGGAVAALTGISGNIFESRESERTEDLSERMVYYKDKTPASSSFRMDVTLSSKSEDVSPVIDTRNSYIVPVQNQIDGGSLSSANAVSVYGGTGYDVEDTLTIGGGGSTEDATVTVTAVTDHAVTGFTVTGGKNFHRSDNIIVTDDNGTATVEVFSEEGQSPGTSKMRYVTKAVTLAPGMSARALKVFLTAQQPFGSKIYTYFKALSEEDSEGIDKKRWKLMKRTTPDGDFFDGAQSSFVGSGNVSGTHEFVFDSDELISYEGTAADGTAIAYDSFRTFAVKIVGFAENTAQPPIIKNFRAIAVF